VCLQCWDTPDDGGWTYPKHVEYFVKYIWEVVRLVGFHYKKSERQILQKKLMAWKKCSYSCIHIKGWEQRGKNSESLLCLHFEDKSVLAADCTCFNSTTTVPEMWKQTGLELAGSCYKLQEENQTRHTVYVWLNIKPLKSNVHYSSITL